MKKYRGKMHRKDGVRITGTMGGREKERIRAEVPEGSSALISDGSVWYRGKGRQEMLQIGEMIQQERRRQKITQEDLCDGICDVSTLSKIENGRQEPNLSTFISLMQRLGLPSERYCSLVSRDDFEAQDLMYEIKRQYAANRYDKVKELLVQLEQYADSKDRIIKQYVMFIRAVLRTVGDRTETAFRKSLDELTQAIKITCSKIDLEELYKGLYSIQEIELINAIAYTYDELGERKKALDLFYQLLKYLRKHCINIEDICRVMPLVSYNYSRLLGLDGRYRDALEICEIGLECCIEYGRTNLLGYLLVNKACCLSELGQSEEAKNASKESYYVLRALKRFNESEMIANFALEKLNFNITEQSEVAQE